MSYTWEMKDIIMIRLLPQGGVLCKAHTYGYLQPEFVSLRAHTLKHLTQDAKLELSSWKIC